VLPVFEESWPLVLLAMRLGVAAALYLFLLTAFSTLRRELGARSQPAARDIQRSRGSDPMDRASVPYEDDAYADEYEGQYEEQVWEPDPLPPLTSALPATTTDRPRRIVRHRERTDGRTIRWSLVVPIVGGVLAVALAVGGVFATRAPGEQAGVVPPTGTDGPFGPPTITPASGQVTVGLAATEDSAIRVTVDGVVQFDGKLSAGERQSWTGSARIQVWTDKGKTLELSVNGNDLGPYSPAMGHPDWNRIDFGFWPGWPN